MSTSTASGGRGRERGMREVVSALYFLFFPQTKATGERVRKERLAPTGCPDEFIVEEFVLFPGYQVISSM